MKRLIQKEVENPFSRLLLEGKFKDGDLVSIDKTNNGLVFGNLEVQAREDEVGERSAA